MHELAAIRSFVAGRVWMSLARVASWGIALAIGTSLAAQEAPPAQNPPAAQAAAGASGPIAIVSLNKNPDAAAKVTGSLEVANGKAIIAASGSVTSGVETTQVTLPRRGVLSVCASTTVKLASDSSVPAGELPGLLMAMDHGAVEMSFADVHDSDILMTPDFRILIGGPGAAEVKVRLGEHGDTCLDDAGVNTSYVLVSSVFDGGAYRVQPGQRVMFQHGSLQAVVDQEKEPCGCPPPVNTQGNEFPLAQSEGLAPLSPPTAGAVHTTPAQASETLAYNAAEHAPDAVEPAKTDAITAAAVPPPVTAPPVPPKKKHSAFVRFFRRLFGAED